jgi:hypothetical protein
MPFDGVANDSIRFSKGKRWDWDRDYKFSPVDRLDAAENAFLDRQLRHMIPRVFVREYARINARSIFPVYFANDPGAETVSYEEITEYGEAEIVRDYADDAPLAEVKSTEEPSRVRSIRAGAQWTIQEVRAAAKAGSDLNVRKTNAARDAMLRKENRIAFLGDADFGLRGLFSAETLTNIPRDTAAATFAAGTAAANLGELHDLANAVPANTEDIEFPDTMLLPPSQYDRISVQKLGSEGDAPTVFNDFIATNPHIRTIIRVRELAGVGTGGTDVAVAYKRDIDKLRLVVALDLEQFPPERRNMVVRVEYHMRTGGLIVHKPLSIRILEGI